MKKLPLLLLATLLTFGLGANNADLFKVDDEKLNEEFAELNKLEQIVTNTEDATFQKLQADHAGLMESIGLKSDITTGIMGLYYEPPLGIPSFVWGLCIGVAGILVVYLVTEDTDETKKALWGCVAGTALYALLYVLYIIILGSSFWWV
jgi:hypothetical protein